MESFGIVWKVSGQSGKFTDSLESFGTVCKDSGQSRKFQNSLESFRIVFFVERFQTVLNDSCTSVLLNLGVTVSSNLDF